MVKMNTAPIKARRSEKSLPKKAVQFNTKFVNDTTLQSTSKRRRYQRRGSKSASMLMAAFSVQQQQHFDEPNEETTILFMDTSPENREAPLNMVQKPQTVEFYSMSLPEKLAHLERIMASSATVGKKAVVA